MADAGDIVGEDYSVDDKVWTDSGSGVTKGQVLAFTSGNVVTATATTDGPYVVAKNTAAASGDVNIVLKAKIYLTASGAITKGQSVSAAAAGKVAATSWDLTTVSTLGANVKRLVGVALTTAADAAVVLVRFEGGVQA